MHVCVLQCLASRQALSVSGFSHLIDGSFACIIPDDMSLKEFQEAPLRLMKWFYSSLSFVRIVSFVVSLIELT